MDLRRSTRPPRRFEDFEVGHQMDLRRSTRPPARRFEDFEVGHRPLRQQTESLGAKSHKKLTRTPLDGQNGISVDERSARSMPLDRHTERGVSLDMNREAALERELRLQQFRQTMLESELQQIRERRENERLSMSMLRTKASSKTLVEHEAAISIERDRPRAQSTVSLGQIRAQSGADLDDLELPWLRAARRPRRDEVSSPNSFDVDYDPVYEGMSTNEIVGRWMSSLDEEAERPAQPRHEQTVVKVVQTPRLDVREFEGDPEGYPFFRAQVEDARGHHPDSDILRHLQGRLKGVAFQAVRGALLSSARLDDVLHILEENFGDPRSVANVVIDRLLERPKVKPDTTDVVRFATEITNSLATLRAVGLEDELDHRRTLDDIARKLPPSALEEWSGVAYAITVEAGDRLKFSHLSNFIRKYAAKKRMTEPARFYKEAAPRRPDNRRPVHALQTSAPPAAANRSVHEAGKEKTPRCFYCGEGHFIRECERYAELPVAERREWATNHGACFWCLRPGHTTSQCRRQRPCGVQRCAAKHHPLLHLAPDAETNATPVGAIANEATICMKTVNVRVHGRGGKSRVCTAFLDEGSAVTLVQDRLVQQLGLDISRRSTLTMGTMNGVSCTSSAHVCFQLENLTTGKRYQVDGARTLHALPIGRQPISMAELKARYPAVNELNLADQGEPQMLIGLDNAELIAARSIRHTSTNGPLLQLTELGWTVTGRAVTNEATEGSRNSPTPVHFVHKIGTSRSLLDAVEASWRTEDFGCRHNGPARSLEDRKAEKILDEEVYHDGERWVAPLLWRHPPTLPPSKAMAERRARGFEKKLDKATDVEPSLRSMTVARMEKMLTDGHFRKLPTRESACCEQPNNAWFLPLHAVQNPNKPGKVRLVLDAAARSRGRCLNDFLMSGPDFLNSIPGVIMRWRERKVALSSDVSAMFSQVRVRKQDLPAQRFLWRGDRRDGPFDVYESPRLMFGATSSPSTAEYCYRKTAEVFATEQPDVRRAIVEDTYVDDLLTGADDDLAATALKDGITRTLRKGGFELAPWISNSAAVSTSQHVGSADDVNIPLGSTSDVTRALGVSWKPSTDRLTFRAKLPSSSVTKRNVLSTAMAVFDPTGFLSGWVLRPKMLLQRLWRRGIDWDEPLPDDLAYIWSDWLAELAELSRVSVRRYLFNEAGAIPSHVELHVFCDASEDGFASVAYFRWSTSYSSDYQVALVTAKSRLAPVKTLTIPRLELQAAVLAARLVAFVQRETSRQVTSTTCWSDSTNVLSWIRATDRRFHTFVANRVAEIHDHTEQEWWRHIPTGLNPADQASRGQALEELLPGNTWQSGPDFLRRSEDQWPQDLKPMSQVLEDDGETKLVFTTATPVSSMPSGDLREVVPDVRRFSKWPIAVRSLALVSRLAKRSTQHGGITADEFAGAERLYMQAIQQDIYASEYSRLQRGLGVSPKSKITSLSPILVDGLICVDTRIRRSSEITTATKFPPILPRDHPYTKLLIQHLHHKMGHRAHDAVVVELRQRCWVPQARRTVRSIVSECRYCRIQKALPRSPRMAPLPLARLIHRGAFCSTGLDYFGPMLTARGRSSVKTWCALFRCLTTKATHLELVESLDTDACLMAITRFQSRRGNVREIYSDNGTNFTAADRELREALSELDHDRILSHLAINGIDWKFNAPADKEAGGVWERCVRSVKQTLRVLLKEQRPHSDTLRTLLCEVERILNSTPLFHVPVDSTDDEVLTPFHFLIGRASPSYPPGLFVDQDLCLRRKWRFAQTLADHFWRRWVKEYLPTLSLRTKWRDESEPVKVGDLVIIADDQHPRGVWPKGIISEVQPGADGVIRTVVVRTKLGQLRRPLRKLIRIDLSP